MTHTDTHTKTYSFSVTLNDTHSQMHTGTFSLTPTPRGASQESSPNGASQTSFSMFHEALGALEITLEGVSLETPLMEVHDHLG